MDFKGLLAKAPERRLKALISSAVDTITLRFDETAKRAQRFQEGEVQLSPAMTALCATVSRDYTRDPVQERVDAEEV